MSSIDAPQSKPVTTSVTCPICLCNVGSNICYTRSRKYTRPIYSDEKRLLEVNQFIFPTPADDDEDIDNSSTINDAQDVFNISNHHKKKHIFELSACSHQFCTVCLRAYIRSKLLDGVVDIPCCHFKLSNDEEDFKPCDILIEEADIYKLLTNNMEDDDNNIDDSYWSRDGECSYNSCSSNETNTTQRNVGPNDLWIKYNKLKFDKRYGKDAVRRCPSCDEATLFDEESIKRYKAKYLTDSRAAVNTSSSSSAAAAAGRKDINESTFAEECKYPEDDDIAQVILESSQSEGITKSTTPLVCCQTCNTEFCYFHSNAHSSKTGELTTIAHCIEYHKKSLDNDRANVNYAVNTLRSKPCPSCGMAVSKEGGCNQMKCPSCNTHFCWLCGAVVDDGAFPAHFRWWNLKGCANMQLDESDQPTSCTKWGAKILSILQILVLGIPAVALTIVTCLICPCFVPGCGRSARERVMDMVSFWGSALSTLIMLPFTCLGMLLVSLLYFFVATITCFVKICSRVRTPSRTPEELRNLERRAENLEVELAQALARRRDLDEIMRRMEEGRGLSQAGNEPLRDRVREEPTERVEKKLPDGVNQDDIQIVMSQAGVSRKKAIKALVENEYNCVDAIMSTV